MAAAGCNSDATGIERDRPPSPVGSSVSGGGGDAAASLVGTWQTQVAIQVPGDLQTVTTTWQFDAAGTCRETRVTESRAQGVPITTDLACTWTSSDTTITVTFANGGGTLVMSFSFSAVSPDQLLLDGFAYQRQS
jgi:sugar (pentulose or hexulose) kinase